ncbi:MAG: LysR family transcriptional regulator [Alphaproteobacteria bacterium]|nr:LysR family transcriptional regulator [Alphaproteobacteria bacterium]
MITQKDFRNLEGLMALKAISVYASKKKAAQEIFSSLDTINKYIHNLEQNLGVVLVDDSGRSSVLTEAGNKVLESMAALDFLWGRICMEKESRKEILGSVSLGVSYGICSYFHPENICEFFDKYPRLRLDFVKLDDVNRSASPNCDVCLTYAPFESPEMALLYKKEIKFGFFASSLYLNKYGYPKDIDDMLANHRILIKGNFVGYSKNYKEGLKKANKLQLMSDAGEMLMRMMQYGAGICASPLIARTEGLVCLDNIPCDAYVTLHLSAHKDIKDSPRVRAVIDYCKYVLDELASFNE